jgi:hypothetical protein
MTDLLQKVDHSALRTSQAVIIILLVLGFILNSPLLVVVVALVMALGTAFKRPGFGIVYSGLLKPRRWVTPDVLLDNPEPHRFAQGFGSLVLWIGVIGFLAGGPVLGWGLSWMVIALAALNLFGGFCVGCAVYYWLNRLKVPGFIKSPPSGTFPGMRPRTQ